jgi:Flp pilus assembly protein TadG
MKTPNSKFRQNGQALIEFTFVGIPIMFVLISVFEVSRGMWVYDTLSYAVKQGARYAIVHGENCGKNGNTCQVNLGPATGACNNTNATIAEVIQCAGVGLDPAATKVTFTSTQGTLGPYSLNAVPGTLWPPANGNSSGNPITIEITTPFNSAIAMFWPGGSPVSFASGILPASSSDQIQY